MDSIIKGLLMLVIMDVSLAAPQGMDLNCPPCVCTGSRSSDSVTTDAYPYVPDGLTSPSEALSFLRARITDRNVYTYVATETLRELDRVMETTVEVSSKFSILAEIVAGHVLDALVPGGSKIIDGLKFVIEVLRSSKSEKQRYKTMLDPASQEKLIQEISTMLENYERKHPSCLKDSSSIKDGMTINHFLYREGICPHTFITPSSPVGELQIIDFRIRVPIDTSLINEKRIIIRGPYAITFDEKATMQIVHQHLSDMDPTNLLMKFAYISYLSTQTNVTRHNVVAYLDPDDLSSLSGDQYSHCLQRSLFRQLDLNSLEVLVDRPIEYSPHTFSESQIAVRRMVCYPPPRDDTCTFLYCKQGKKLIEYFHQNFQSPDDFNTNYEGSIRIRRHRIGMNTTL